MKRTQEEIQAQIAGLEKEKTLFPEYSKLGTPNHAMANVKIEILQGRIDLDDIDEGDWDEMDEDNEIYRAAEEAQDWLEGMNDEDLFSID